MTNEQRADDMIDRYLTLRDYKKKADAEYNLWRKQEYDDPMQEIENTLLGILNQTGSSSLRTKKGTAVRVENVSVTTSDGSALREWVIGNADWELVDWRPNKTAVKELVRAGEPLPPGINYQTFYNISVRSPQEK